MLPATALPRIFGLRLEPGDAGLVEVNVRTWLKVAWGAGSATRPVKEQVPRPLQPAPDHPPKAEVPSGVAVSVTSEP